MNKQKFFIRLYSARKLYSSEERIIFEDALINLQGNILIDDICELCKIFCDDTEDEEMMFGLIHLIEQCKGQEYLRCIAKFSPNMTEAHDWAMILNKRILNSQNYFQPYAEIIVDLESNYQTSIIELLMDVKNDNPKMFGEKVDYILEKVNG